MADDENIPGSENPTPAPAPAPAEPKPVAAPAKAPAKRSVGAQIKKEQAEQMVQGEDGKMHRKVPTVVKIKAFLALALPILFVVLIGVGFLPLGNNGNNLYVEFWDIITGKAPQGGKRKAPGYAARLEKADTNLKQFEDDLTAGAEILKATDKEKMLEAGMKYEATAGEMNNWIKDLENCRKYIHDNGIDEPSEGDFSDRIMKFNVLKTKMETLSKELNDKWRSLVPGGTPKPPEKPGEPGKPNTPDVDNTPIIESGPAHPQKKKEPEPPKEEPKKEEPKPEPPKEEPKPEPMPPKEEPKPEPPKEEAKPPAEPPKEEPKPEPMPPKEEPKPEPPKEEPKPEPPKEEPKPEPPKQPTAEQIKDADKWVDVATRSLKDLAGKVKELPSDKAELQKLLDQDRKTQSLYKKAIDIYQMSADYAPRVEKLNKLVAKLDEWAKSIEEKLK